MGFFLTAAAFIAVLALSSWAIDEPIRRWLAAHDAAARRLASRRSVVPADPADTCAVMGRVIRVSVRSPEDPSGLVAAIDDATGVVGIRLPSSVAGFIHTGEILSVTGVRTQTAEGPRIEPLEAAIVGETGWSIQLPLQAGVASY